jgi:hypothetical protein
MNDEKERRARITEDRVKRGCNGVGGDDDDDGEE